MNHSNDLNNILETLRQEHRSIEPPASIESDLIEQTHRVRATPPSPRSWFWIGGLGLATAAVSILVFASLHSNRPVAPSAHIVPAESPIASSTPQVATTPSEPVPKTVNHPPITEHKRNKPIKDDIASEHFFPLPSSEGLPSPSEATVVMMQIHTDALRAYGLELPPTASPRMILAEFIVGEDGLPRSIRILQ
jgi:hypothetical protein